MAALHCGQRVKAREQRMPSARQDGKTALIMPAAVSAQPVTVMVNLLLHVTVHVCVCVSLVTPSALSTFDHLDFRTVP